MLGCKAVLMLIAIATLARCQHTGTKCPRPCRCDEPRKTVFCNEKKLIYLPYGIPRDTHILHLQNNALVNSPSLDDILGQLTQLKRLDLSYNSLTSFPKQLPPSLEVVSLKHNNIKYIGRNALSKMKSLRVLFLDHNNITNRGLWPTAFQGTDNLISLSFTGNLLDQFPVGLPEHAKMIRLDYNKIKTVSKIATQNLIDLETLDLSHNQIDSEMIEVDSLVSLMKLQSLDVSNNALTGVPKNLPNSLTELLLSNNKISYIYATTDKQDKHGIFQSTPSIRRLDLSNNMIKSVEPGAFLGFSDLFMVMLHSNPWQCDCHLKYLKEWMATTSSIIGSISSTQCEHPAPLNGVNLHSLDLEALTCDLNNPKLVANKIETNIVEITSSWEGILKPPYLSFRLLYGPIKCQNCSIPKSASISTPYNQAIYWVSSYDVRQMPPMINANTTTFKISGLKSNTQYIVCTIPSEENPLHTEISNCIDFRTNKENVVVPRPESFSSIEEIPVWIIALAAGLVVVITILIVVSALWIRHVKRRRGRRNLTGTSILYNRKEEYPQSLIQQYLSDNRLLGQHRSDSNLFLATNQVDPMSPVYNGRMRDIIPTADARTEFSIITRREEERNNLLQSTTNSGDSYSNCDGTMSTYRTDLGTSISSGNHPVERSASRISLPHNISSSRTRLPIITNRPNSAAQFVNCRQLSYNDILHDDPSLFV